MRCGKVSSTYYLCSQNCENCNCVVISLEKTNESGEKKWKTIRRHRLKVHIKLIAVHKDYNYFTLLGS